LLHLFQQVKDIHCGFHQITSIIPLFSFILLYFCAKEVNFSRPPIYFYFHHQILSTFYFLVSSFEID